jgi:hypothetical protein
MPGVMSPARALVIDATFDSSITSLANAAAVEGSINAAIAVLETDITSNVTATIDFQNSSSGLGGSSSYVYYESYYSYYNALKAVDTAPGASAAQQAAFASLGGAPSNANSVNPVTGSSLMLLTGPNARLLGFNANPGAANFDTVISLNTSITSPPNGLSVSYGLQAVAAHELDEALGIGGTGSTIGAGFSGNPAGALDPFRYSAPGVRSYTTSASATSYFSIDGGNTVLSYFNQSGGGSDYGDWASDPIPNGYGYQVQDAYGQPGTDPALGPNELTALNVIGYKLAPVPEPMALAIMAPAVLGLVGLRRQGRKTQT